jgi:tight adherence protein C
MHPNPILPILISILGAGSVLLLAWELLPSRDPLLERIRKIRSASDRVSGEHFDQLNRVEALIVGEKPSDLTRRMSEAGWYDLTPRGYAVRGGAWIGGGAIVGFALYVMGHGQGMYPLIAMLLPVVCWRMPKIGLDRAIKTRKAAISRAIPDFIDLLSTTVEAGLALSAAMVQTTEATTGPLREELETTMTEIRLGRNRNDALKAMAERINEPEISRLIQTLTQADRMGGNVSEILRGLANDARNARWMKAEEIGAQLPVRMLIPMALFMLPALYLIIFGPAAAQILLQQSGQ